jgi:hypothetical protein
MWSGQLGERESHDDPMCRWRKLRRRPGRQARIARLANFFKFPIYYALLTVTHQCGAGVRPSLEGLPNIIRTWADGAMIQLEVRQSRIH